MVTMSDVPPPSTQAPPLPSAGEGGGNEGARRAATPAPVRPPLASLDELDDFDTVIDARSPAEFADDHIPGAINCPVLDDAQRAEIGTMYCQVSPFAARRVGAAMAARNIARHIEQSFADKPKSWRPLIYCWRGGQRSGSMTTVLQAVGWSARQLQGGYKAYRKRVLTDLAELPQGLRFVVLHGPTGSGKTALLMAIAAAGGQTLDLEAIARHRGSVLGAMDAAQPGQRSFESAIWQALRRFDPARPVFVESESRRVGRLTIPEALFEVLIGARCVRIAVPVPARVAHLVEEYADLTGHAGALRERLEFFVPLYGRKTVERWQHWTDEADWPALAEALIRTHYDPAYSRGGTPLYRRAFDEDAWEVASLDRTERERIARAILQRFEETHA